MRSIPPTVLMYLAMMSSALCADSGRAQSVSPASLRSVFRMGSPRRDTVFDSGSLKIVVSEDAGALVGHQLSRSAPRSGGGRRTAPDSKAACSAQAAPAFAKGLGSGAVVCRRHPD